MATSIIKVEHISKRYRLGDAESGSLYHSLAWQFKRLIGKGKKKTESEFWALNDVSFEIAQGDVVGIIGRNGAGKSTLLKILSRITPPTSGRITVHGRIASLLEVGTGFHPELTGRENIFLNGAILGMSKQEIRQKFDQIVDFSGIERFLDTPVKRYSSGMYVRLAFAVAAHLDPEILIIDEVLAVGDTEFQKKCLGKMNEVANSGRTVLFVSHNMATVKNLCTKGIYLQQGQVNYAGELDAALSRYLSQDQASEKHYESGALRYIRVEQQEDQILLEAHYDCDHELDLPNLGFILHDDEGRPIMGMNPKMNPTIVQKTNQKYPKQGKVQARIRQPQLMDGVYSFSIFFGDKYQDYFSEPNCISLEIFGMTKMQQLYKASLLGYVVPDCIFDFS